MTAPESTGAGRLARVRARFLRLPEKARLVVVAALGAGIGFVTYQLVYWLNPLQPRAATSWIVAFAIGVPRQFSLHRWLTFDSGVPYAPRLARAYALYATLAVITTSLDWWLVEREDVSHHVAWLACVATTGTINWFALKPLVFGDAPRPDQGQAG